MSATKRQTWTHNIVYEERSDECTRQYEEHSDEDTIRERACSNDAIIMNTQIVSDSERANEVRSALARSEDNSIV
jgi:hypothetical protein